MNLRKTKHLACVAATAVLPVWAQGTAATESFEATVRGLGAVDFRLADGSALRMDFSFPDRGLNSGDVFEAEHVKDGARIPAVVWEGRNYALATPVKLWLSELRGLGLWIRGNGSYGKVKLLLSKAGSPYPYEVECGERGYVTFSGWQYVDMDFSEWTPACGWLKGADEVTLEKIQVGTTRVALDPLEMRPTVGTVAVGPVYALPKAGVTAITVEEEQSRRAWDNTEDKDR